MIMKTLIRAAFVAVALVGSISAVSAAPHKVDHRRYDNNSFDTGVIADFNKAAHTED
jgi:hypothetical protein